MIDISCPSQPQAWNEASYNCTSGVNIPGADITGIIAYTLQQCMDACSTMNVVAGTTRCVGVALNGDMSARYGVGAGANCWLKERVNAQMTEESVVVATLQT